MHELHASNDLLDDPVALRARLDEEGYVLLRDVVDHGLVRQLKHGIMAWFRSQGLIRVVDGEPMYDGADFSGLGQYPPSLYDTRLWEWFAMRPETRQLIERVFGEPGYLLPIGSYQHTWPGKEGRFIHQDGPASNGLDFNIFWVPLMDIDEALGGLAVAPRLHRDGAISRQAGTVMQTGMVAPGLIDDDAWHRADYHPGDLLVFTPFTPHHGLPNSGDRLRLSVDFRVQRASTKRALTGVVVDAGPGTIVLAADRGDEVELVIDDQSVVWLKSFAPDGNDTSGTLGERVIVAEEDGRALLVRNGWGHIPWEP